MICDGFDVTSEQQWLEDFNEQHLTLAEEEAERFMHERMAYASAPEESAVAAAGDGESGCGHPNHGAQAHDCIPFLSGGGAD